ncbi:MAG: O-methyltransferase [Melioribacteraceae bacterium]|nr:MAG: O-methyltransferase [Melioribacteraceae bacterium]
MQIPETADQLRKIVTGFQQSRVILSGFELKVFTHLDNKGSTAEKLARKIKADERALSRLLNALCALGLLRKIRDIYFNSDLASRHLVEGKPDYMGNLFHTDHTYHLWNNLTESVKAGTAVKGSEINDRGEEWLEAFIAAMHYRGEHQAEILSKMIYIESAETMLDVGGGSGAFSTGFLKAYPNLKATIFDLPNVIPITKKYVKKSNFADRVGYISGDYMKDEFEGKYDFIFLSAIVHMHSYPENEELVKKCSESLNDGGKIMIMDFVMDESRLKPEHGAFFALNMLVATRNGDTYTEDEIKEWYTRAGLSNVVYMNTPFGTSIVSAEKV